MDEKKRDYYPSPYLKANFISKLFFCWVSPFMKLGNRRTLEEDDLYSTTPGEESRQLSEGLEEEWNNEVKKAKSQNKRPSLARTLIRIYGVRLILISIIPCFEEASKFLQPILIAGILKYFHGLIGLRDALIYSSIIVGFVMICSVLHHPYYFVVIKLGVRFRLACSGLIYKKILRLNLSTIENQAGGQILNLIANDATRIEISPYFVAFLMIGPVLAVASLVMLARIIDSTFLNGFLLILAILLTQVILARVYNHYRRRASQKCDERIDLLEELFNGIKIIKMYCWEEPYSKMVDALRKQELTFQKSIFIISGFNQAVDLFLHSLVTYVSVTAFLYFANMPLMPSYVVFAISYYVRISAALGFFFVKAITILVAARVSVRRIEDFLLQDEINLNEVNVTAHNHYVKAQNFCAYWTEEKHYDAFKLKNLNLDIGSNEFVAIIGGVGSGKSSLLLSLLGEMKKTSGYVQMSGKVFYVPQEPWIFTATIQKNILFGKPFDQDKFNRVVRACSLDKDLALFPQREMTIIGEKGINLSGGQRARVSVARALYSDADIYLFDDPLSAVDANVAKHLMDNCINGYLKDRIRILATHQTHQLLTADKILVLEDGEIKFSGTHSELKQNGINMDYYCQAENKSEDKTPNKSAAASRNVSPAKSSRRSSVVESPLHDRINLENKLSGSPLNDMSCAKLSFMEDSDESAKKDVNLREEKRFKGAVSWRVLVSYFITGGGVPGMILSMTILLVAQVITVGSDYFLSKWASKEESDWLQKTRMQHKLLGTNTADKCCSNYSHVHFDDIVTPFEQRQYYFMIYSILIALCVVFAFLRSLAFYGFSLRASRNLHSRMFKNVLNSPIRFFDLNPLGRIMNRFSKDIGQLDETIPSTSFDFLCVFMTSMSTVVLSVFVNYWIVLPVLPLAFLFIYVRNYFLKVSREIKRIDGVCRSPIYVHINQTLTGISVIRANKCERLMNQEYHEFMNDHTKTVIAFLCSNRWLSIRLDWITNLYVAVSIFSCILLKDYLGLDSGQIGILLTYITQLTGLFQWNIQQSCEVENLMTSVERIIEYTDLENEPLDEGEQKPPKHWPREGNLTLRNVSFSYDHKNGLPNVLEKLSLKIRAGEKVGIVGRTGAGKSSIIQTIFRMAEANEGRMLIDGVDIQKLSLHDLRSKLAIIPQEPTLFIGTVRSNLDPFNEFTDQELWYALEQVQLKETISDTMSGGLDAQIQKNGSNLSVGQKQLICLARAILKRSKILLIDEATANVDFKTDALVQQAIRTCFSDCTVITIAHRLQTIADSDKLICMSRGRAVNIGVPYDLIKGEKTIFRELVFDLESSEKNRIIEICKETKEKLQTTKPYLFELVEDEPDSPNSTFELDSIRRELSFSSPNTSSESSADVSVVINEKTPLISKSQKKL